VSALTPDELIFFDSSPDSGYTVDNLFPVAPEQLLATITPSTVSLCWNGNPGPDIHHYNIYRHEAGDCDNRGKTPVAAVADLSWIDNSPNDSIYERCYTVTAVDFSGNEGPGTEWSDANISTVPGLPQQFALNAASPNPFNPHTKLSFALAKTGYLTLDIYDMRGLKVRTLADGHFSAGTHEVDWLGRDNNGHNLASGVYLVRLQQGSLVAQQRVTLLK